MELFWLSRMANWDALLKETESLQGHDAVRALMSLANARTDYLQTLRLDRVLRKRAAELKEHLRRTSAMRLAVLGSSTLAHLLPAIRVSSFRRGIWVESITGRYGMYYQDLMEPSPELAEFKPDVILLALDAHHLTADRKSNVASRIELIGSCWELARKQFGAAVIQQTVLPVAVPILGSNEHYIPGSPAQIIADLNVELRKAAQCRGVSLLAVDTLAQMHGTRSLFNATLWHKSKQEIHPAASLLWADMAARLLAAMRGLSHKCLVLDLDNTLWGGVIGDDGLEGIVLGQGNALGEAFREFQDYVLSLGNRGIILAVCSKNDEAVARNVFEQHPEMLLRTKDIACFVANWKDKAENLRCIAQTLNIGLDSLVFVDDNPFERNLIRQELPMVAVPELPDDPAQYPETLGAAGYFEALEITQEDKARGQQYKANEEREASRKSATDMQSYLRSLEMRLIWAPFDEVGLARIVQLINKTNQFNLTTRRFTTEQVMEIMRDPSRITFQFRLIDRFGDNGVIAVVILGQDDSASMEIETFLMSCRVLGRQVEESILNILVQEAKARGACRLRGVYRPTEKNGMVKNLYANLGFTAAADEGDGGSFWILEFDAFAEKITTVQATRD